MVELCNTSVRNKNAKLTPCFEIILQRLGASEDGSLRSLNVPCMWKSFHAVGRTNCIQCILYDLTHLLKGMPMEAVLLVFSGIITSILLKCQKQEAMKGRS